MFDIDNLINVCESLTIPSYVMEAKSDKAATLKKRVDSIIERVKKFITTLIERIKKIADKVIKFRPFKSLTINSTLWKDANSIMAKLDKLAMPIDTNLRAMMIDAFVGFGNDDKYANDHQEDMKKMEEVLREVAEDSKELARKMPFYKVKDMKIKKMNLDRIIQSAEKSKSNFETQLNHLQKSGVRTAPLEENSTASNKFLTAHITMLQILTFRSNLQIQIINAVVNNTAPDPEFYGQKALT